MRKLNKLIGFAFHWTVLFMLISSILFLLFFPAGWLFLFNHLAVFPIYFVIALFLTFIYFTLRDKLRINTLGCILLLLLFAVLISAYTLEDFEYYAGIGRKTSRILSLEEIKKVSVQEMFRFVGFITSLIWVIYRDARKLS